jgi:hypothetical protein
VIKTAKQLLDLVKIEKGAIKNRQRDEIIIELVLYTINLLDSDIREILETVGDCILMGNMSHNEIVSVFPTELSLKQKIDFIASGKNGFSGNSNVATWWVPFPRGQKVIVELYWNIDTNMPSRLRVIFDGFSIKECRIPVDTEKLIELLERKIPQLNGQLQAKYQKSPQ